MLALMFAAALTAAPGLPTGGHAPTAAADACKPARPAMTAGRGAQRPRKLTELPDARLMRTVIRTVGGCYVAEVKTAAGDWRYEPDGKAAPFGLMPDRPNPYALPLR